MNGCTNPGCSLSFGQAVANKVLSLYDGNSTEAASGATSFFGLGVNSNTLRFQAGATTSQFIFYQGASAPIFALSQNYALIAVSTYISANLSPAAEYYSPTPALHLRAGNTNNETGILFECAGYSTSMIGTVSNRLGLTYATQTGGPGHYFRVGSTYNSNLLTTGTAVPPFVGGGAPTHPTPHQSSNAPITNASSST